VAELFASGRVVDGIVMLMIIEYAVLIFLRKRSGSSLSASSLVANLAAGAALLLSLRAALVGSSWRWVSIWLLLALLAHAADLKMRWAAAR
jgi:hypothetical protein